MAVWTICVVFCRQHAGAALTFSNTNSIIINDIAVATPYPSSLTVTGLAGVLVTKATVTLTGLSHGFPSDISVLLVGPQGQESLVMSEVGGQSRYSVTNLTITLDDDATNPLPFASSLVSGTFQPANGYLVLGHPALPYDFPPPAPPSNSNAPSTLSVFKNTDATGTWDLYVLDDSGAFSGVISGGWTLSLRVAVPLEAARGQTNLVVSWPVSSVSCVLQSADSLAAIATWSNMPAPPAPVSGRWFVTNPIEGGSRFYRLTGH
jgi:subtilisin-like proprotein convertase family protein